MTTMQIRKNQTDGPILHAMKTISISGLVLLSGLTGANAQEPFAYGVEESMLQKSSSLEGIAAFTAQSKYWSASDGVGIIRVRYSSGLTEPCTASLLTSQYLITAKHCIHHKNDEVIRITFTPNFLLPGNARGWSTVKNDPVEELEGLDIAILELENAAPPSYGIILLSGRPVLTDEELFIIHHPKGIAKTLTRRMCRATPKCEEKSPPNCGDNDGPDHRDPRAFYHYCHTEKGSSGAPIFLDNIATPRVAAIHILGADDESSVVHPSHGEVNTGIPILEIAKQSCIVQAVMVQADPSECVTSL